MPRAKDAFFRAGVGALVLDSSGERVLVLRRADVHDHDAWQMPQGGIHREESPAAALRREVAEEIGLEPGDYDVVAEHDEWLAYELPEPFRSDKTGRGQVQRWFVLRLRDADAEVVPDGVEFDRARWLPLGDLAAATAPFRRPAYRRLAAFAASLVPDPG